MNLEFICGLLMFVLFAVAISKRWLAPFVGLSSAPSMFMSVVLPEPERPFSIVSTPSFTVMFISLRA